MNHSFDLPQDLLDFAKLIINVLYNDITDDFDKIWNICFFIQR